MFEQQFVTVFYDHPVIPSKTVACEPVIKFLVLQNCLKILPPLITNKCFLSTIIPAEILIQIIIFYIILYSTNKNCLARRIFNATNFQFCPVLGTFRFDGSFIDFVWTFKLTLVQHTARCKHNETNTSRKL